MNIGKEAEIPDEDVPDDEVIEGDIAQAIEGWYERGHDVFDTDEVCAAYVRGYKTGYDRLREQLVIANEQIRGLCAESASQIDEIRSLTERLRKEKGANAENNDIIRRLVERAGCACGNPAEHGPHSD